MRMEKVASGVDTLVVGYHIGEYLDSGDLELLKEAKDRAQEKKKMFGGKEGASFEFHGADFAMQPRGQSGYDFIFRNDDVTVRVAREARGGTIMPEVHVTYRSHYLATVGLEGACAQVKTWLSQWADVLGEKVSRADPFVDMAMESFPNIDIRREVVSLAKGRAVFQAQSIAKYVVGLRITGYAIGSDQLMCRIYDKTVEVQKKQKEWWYEVWLANTWDREMLPTVARTEFQCRREFLKEMSVDTVDDLIKRLADIWWYLTHRWLRICKVGSATNQARWKEQEFWEAMQSSIVEFGEQFGVLRLHVKRVRYGHLMTQIRGCAVSAGAVLASGRGLAEGMHKIRQDIRSMVSADDFRTDVEERQALVGNMLKPDTHLADAALRAGAELSGVEF